MYSLLLTILVILSGFIVIAIFMQPTKNQSSNVFDSSANDLLSGQKHGDLKLWCSVWQDFWSLSGCWLPWYWQYYLVNKMGSDFVLAFF